MTAPRLEIDLDKVHHNARVLAERLAQRNIGVTGVTKATLGSVQIARVLLGAGLARIGDSRIENIERMRCEGLTAPMTLLRSPMLSQVRRVVMHADVSLNTELEVIRALSRTAGQAKRMHGVVLMVELGDLREGIMPRDLERAVHETLRLPNVALRGIGTNLACHSGVSPGADNMLELSSLSSFIETRFGLAVDIVSGGNSANLSWALGGEDTGRVNDLRLGEAILLGREPLHREPIEGLHTDAITLFAEVIESKVKPSRPWGEIGQTAFGDVPVVIDGGELSRTLLAIGRQDTDPGGLTPPGGIQILGASSDHLIVNSGRHCMTIGTEVSFQVNYSALVRAMASTSVAKVWCSVVGDRHAATGRGATA
jgi:predicted amino acid racemase